MTEQDPALLVTGGAGFLGAHLVRALLAQPEFAAWRVVVLDDLSGGRRENLPDDPRLRFVQGSVTDAELVDDIFNSHHIRYVYHLAAYAAEGLSHFIRRFNYTNNLIGSVTLLNASVRHGIDCFVFTSSIAVYGAGQTPMTEDTTPEPEDPYGIAKYAVELDLRAAQRLFGLDSITFRPHNVYGEYQNIGDRYRNVVGIFMNCLLQGQPLPIFGDGTQQRAFTYVGDIIPIIARSPLVPGARNGCFNLGARRPYSVNELATHVVDAFGLPPRVQYLPARQEVAVAYARHERARHIFGDWQETPLDEGLARMARWVQTVGARETPAFTQLEILSHLPASWSRDEPDAATPA